MGIPKFASWLTKKFPDMVSKQLPTNVHGLYIDMNGIIHPCCHSQEDAAVNLRTEDEMMHHVCLCVDELVRVAKPSSLLYLAMDGVAPRAKMNQQRARRYMSAVDKQIDDTNVGRETNFTAEEHASAKRELQYAKESMDLGIYHQEGTVLDSTTPLSSNTAATFLMDEFIISPTPSISSTTTAIKKQQKEIKKSDFDSNCISPGTTFMTKCAEVLRQFIALRVVADDPSISWKHLCVILSDTNTPGEGEHKIIDFIRVQMSMPHAISNMRSESHVVMGLDADLILLCLSLHVSRMFIMRDSKRRVGREKNSTMDVNGDGAEKMVDAPKIEKRVDTPKIQPAKEPAVSAPGKRSTSPPAQGEMQKKKSAQQETRRSNYEYYNIDVVGNAIVSEIFCNTSSLKWMNNIAGTTTSGHPCYSSQNSRVIDDFITLATVMGNDFVPRLPSCFCGDSAMDNIMEAYCRSVLPFGFLTNAAVHDVDLVQLHRFFTGYAQIETSLFRQYCMKAKMMTASQASAKLGDPVDDIWRKPYYASTTVTEKNVDDACVKYIEGVRFVFRYYSTTSEQVSWSWFYPSHDAPFAADIARVLEARGRLLQPPLLEREPPCSPFVQLMAILPPTSSQLLPLALGRLMHNPPAGLASTFPRKWSVDYSASNDKEHLASILLPFADVPLIILTVDEVLKKKKKGSAMMSELELHRNRSRSGVHDVYCVASIAEQLLSGCEELQSVVDDNGPISHLSTKFQAVRGNVQLVAKALVGGAWCLEYRDSPPQPNWKPRTYSPTANVPILNPVASALHGKKAGFRLRRSNHRGSPLHQTFMERTATMWSCNDLFLAGAKGICLGDLTLLLMISSSAVSILLSPTWVAAAGNILTCGFVGLISTFIYLVVGVGLHYPSAGSGITRNVTRDAFLDWLCVDCLSLNFARNEYCFQCGAPYDEAQINSWAIFSGKIPQSPPPLEPNHTPYLTPVCITCKSNSEEMTDPSNVGIL